jgi:hypothetical protein
MKAFLALSLIVTLALAHTDDDQTCDHSTQNFIEKLYSWFSSKDGDISNAPCKTKSVPALEMMERIVNKDTGENTDAEIHGVQFKDEDPQLIKAFKDLTTARSIMGDRVNPRGQINIQVEYKVNPGCHKVVCAVEKIWGKEAGMKMLYLKIVSDFNTSELAFSDSRRFQEDELVDVIIAFEDIPPHLKKIGLNTNQRLTPHAEDSLSRNEDRKIHANAVIMLFPLWTKQSRSTRQYIIFHELAHNISSRLNNLDESAEWLNMSKWISKDDTWRAILPSACFISGYAKANPWEDFAETLSAYRYNGENLKKKCPEKYLFMKERVFQGIEYLESDSCGIRDR